MIDIGGAASMAGAGSHDISGIHTPFRHDNAVPVSSRTPEAVMQLLTHHTHQNLERLQDRMTHVSISYGTSMLLPHCRLWPDEKASLSKVNHFLLVSVSS